MDDDLKQLLEAMRQENASTHQETRRHFDVAVERIETRFDFLAEAVQHVSEELQRTRMSLDGEIYPISQWRSWKATMPADGRWRRIKLIPSN